MHPSSSSCWKAPKAKAPGRQTAILHWGNVPFVSSNGPYPSRHQLRRFRKKLIKLSDHHFHKFGKTEVRIDADPTKSSSLPTAVSSKDRMASQLYPDHAQHARAEVAMRDCQSPRTATWSSKKRLKHCQRDK